VVSGTLARARDELRVTAQLTDVEAGTLLWSETQKGSVSDLFALQDALVDRIVTSLALPLSTREKRQLRGDVPASARAYEFYLRANQLSVDANSWPVARDLYLQALEEDPRYAPAWARLGRVYRLIGKYRPEARDASLARAEEALARALALNADLPLAHSLYAQVDADRGKAQAAMVRLLERAARGGASPDIFAGLVHACRYCGLIEASIAADARANHLDATLETSVMHTYFVAGRHAEALASHHALKAYVYVMSLFALGRDGEALQLAGTLMREGNRVSGMVAAAAALIERRRDASLAILDDVVRILIDPEGHYYAARQYAHLDAPERALTLLSRAVDGGYFCHAAMQADPWLAAVRGDRRFAAQIARAAEGHARARAAFDAAGGARILGLPGQ
jgi:tetratricopeptide (TPR) repeat protein